MKKILFWINFLNLIISIPVGILADIAYGIALSYLHGIKTYGLLSGRFAPLTKTDYLIMAGIMAVCIFWFWGKNVWRYFYKRQRNFSLFRKRLVSDWSDSKRQAANPQIPKEYLTGSPAGNTVGRVGNSYFNIPSLSDDDTPIHTVLIGGSGSNKTTTELNFLIDKFNYHPEGFTAVFAYDCKPDISKRCVDEHRSDVKIIGPAVMTRYGFDMYYGLGADATDDELASHLKLVADTMIESPPDKSNEFFYKNARNIITAFFMYHFRIGDSFGESVVAMRETRAEDLISTILDDPRMDAHPKIRRRVRAFEGKDDVEAFQDIVMTLQTDLEIFDRDSVQWCFSNKNPKLASPLDMENGVSLFLAIPDDLTEEFSVVFRLIAQAVLKHFSGLPAGSQAGKKYFIYLDEIASAGKIEALLPALAKVRDRNAAITLCVQSYFQLEAIYGKAGVKTIMDNCRATLVLSCQNTETARELSERTGTYRERMTSTHSSSKSKFGIESVNTSDQYRPCLEIGDICSLEARNQALVFVKGSWALIDKCPFFCIEKYRKTSERIEKINEEFYLFR